MARDPGPVHDNLRRLIDAASGILLRVPDTGPLSGSLRADEQAELIRTQGGGGRERANLHDRLNNELMPFLANIFVLVEGVADLFEAGVKEHSRGFNSPALTVLVRAPLEAAAQVVWLLDDDVPPSDRVRRYLIWTLADLDSQYRMVAAMASDPEQTEHLADKESRILEWIGNAKWEGQPRTMNKRGNPVPAALLDTSESAPKRLRIPSRTALVNALVGSDIAYPVLSISAHGDRWAITDTMTKTDRIADDGRSLKRVTGFGVSPNMLKAVAQLAVIRPITALARWNGIDISALKEPVRRLQAVTLDDDTQG